METLAAIDSSGNAVGVLKTARSLAALLATDVRAVHVFEGSDQYLRAMVAAAGVPLRISFGDPTTGILDSVGEDDVAVAVIGTGTKRADPGGVGHVARRVMTSASKPVALVPPTAMGIDSSSPVRVIVPLDGSRATARGVQQVLARFGGRGTEIVAVHVFDCTNAPAYWDHFYYDFPTWHARFQQDNCAPPFTRLEVGCGSVVGEVLRMAEVEAAGLIAVAWSQVLAPGRALVVTELLRATTVPVLLVPADTAPARPAPLALEHAG